MLLEIVDHEHHDQPPPQEEGNAFNKLKAKLETTDTKPKNSSDPSASSAIATLSPEEIAQLVVKAVNKKQHNNNNNQQLSSSSHHTSPTESPNSSSSQKSAIFMDGGSSSSAIKNVNAVSVGTAAGGGGRSRHQSRSAVVTSSAPVVDQTRSRSTSRRCGRDALYGAANTVSASSSSSAHGRSSSRDRRARSTGRSSHRRDISTGRQQQQNECNGDSTNNIRRRETSVDRGSKRNSSRERSGRKSSSRERPGRDDGSGRRSNSVDRNSSSRRRRDDGEDTVTPARRRLKDAKRDASTGRSSSVDARSRRDRHHERDSSVDRSTRRRARSRDPTAKSSSSMSSSSTTRSNSRERHTRSSTSSHNREDNVTNSVEAEGESTHRRRLKKELSETSIPAEVGGESTPRRKMKKELSETSLPAEVGGESTPRRRMKKELSEASLPAEGSKSPKSPRMRSERKSSGSGSRSPRPGGRKLEQSGPTNESQDFRSPRPGNRRTNSTTSMDPKDIHKSPRVGNGAPRKVSSFTSPGLVTPGGSMRKAGSSRKIKFEPKAKEKCADLALEDGNCRLSDGLSNSIRGSKRGNRMIKVESKSKLDSTGSDTFDFDVPPPPPPPPDDLETPEHQSRSKLDGIANRKSSNPRPTLTPRRNLSSSSHDQREEIEFPVPIQEQSSCLPIDTDDKGFKEAEIPSSSTEEKQLPPVGVNSTEESSRENSGNEIEDIRSFARSIWDDDSVEEAPQPTEGSGGKSNVDAGNNTNQDSLPSREGRRTVRSVPLKGAPSKNRSAERSSRSARSTELGRSVLSNSERSNASTKSEGRPLYKTMSEKKISSRKENDPNGSRQNRGLSSSAHDAPRKNDDDDGFDVVKPAHSKWWALKSTELTDGFNRPTTPKRTRVSQDGVDRPTTPARIRMSQGSRPSTPGRNRPPVPHSTIPKGIDAPNTMTQKERVDRKQASSCRKANILESLAGVLEESDTKLEVKNGTTRVVLELGDAPLGLVGK